MEFDEGPRSASNVPERPPTRGAEYKISKILEETHKEFAFENFPKLIQHKQTRF